MDKIEAIVETVQQIYRRLSFIKRLLGLQPNDQIQVELKREFTIVRRTIACVTFGALLFPSGTGYVYILELEENKFYIGWSEFLMRRLDEHFTMDGSLWTKKYKPISVIAVRQGDKELEKTITVKYMKEKGFENVRGGPWCKLEYKTIPNAVR